MSELSTTHYLLIRRSVHNVGPKVLGSYSNWDDADQAQRRLGGALLELTVWEENDPGYAEGLTFVAEWLDDIPAST